MRMSSIVRAVYWIFIIGTAFGAYYFLQPYIDQLKGIYGEAGDALNNFRQINQQDLLNKHAWVAQSVERSPEEGQVGSAILPPGTKAELL